MRAEGAVEDALRPVGSLLPELRGVHGLVAGDSAFAEGAGGERCVLLVAVGIGGVRRAGADDDLCAFGHSGGCHGGIDLGEQAGRRACADMTGTVGVVGVLVQQTRGGLQQADHVVVNLSDGFAGLIAIEGLRLGLDGDVAIGADEEEVSKGAVEAHLTDGVVALGVGDVLHRSDVPLGVDATTNESVAAFPEGVGEVALALEVTRAEGAEQPVGTGDVVGIELEHAGEVTPAEHVVDPLGVRAGDPCVAGLGAVAHAGVGDEG